MRNYKQEFDTRVKFIRKLLINSGAEGIVFGNSGGKDSALAGLLCKAACDNTLGVIMPCVSKRNYNEDANDAEALAKKYGIKSMTVDLTPVYEKLKKSLGATTLTDTAKINIAPRLRMTTLYAIAASQNRLVAGTGNRSEIYVGYFTKWGDGAYDFNPISDLTVTEVYEFLDFLYVPDAIINKPPSAGLYEGQTDELDMGISYAAIDQYILHGIASEHDKQIIDQMHNRTQHKRNPPVRLTP